MKCYIKPAVAHLVDAKFLLWFSLETKSKKLLKGEDGEQFFFFPSTLLPQPLLTLRQPLLMHFSAADLANTTQF